MAKRKGSLTLSDLPKGTVFKVEEACTLDGVKLTLEGVYAVTVKRADYGKMIGLCDLASVRRKNEVYWYGKFKVPADQARTTAVYKLPRF